MSGITAISATKTIASGDTSVDNAVTGFVTKEQISLGLTGSPLTATWSISKPSQSGSACRLSNDSQLTTLFSPDVEGIYTISCLVDSVTTYILRIAAVRVSTISAVSALHLLPCINSQIPAPSSGAILFYSSDSDSLCIKLPDNSIQEITTS